MKSKIKRKHGDYQEYLLSKLKDEDYASFYLDAASLDEDQRVFLLAIANVLEAQSNKDNLTLFESLRNGLIEIILHEKGLIQLKACQVEVGDVKKGKRK